MLESPYVIAEAGINHNGEWELARDLIDAAATAGADAVKFQIWQTEELVSDSEQIDLFEQWQFEKHEWDELAAAAEQVGIDFLASVFDSESLAYYTDLNPSYIKIASCDVTHIELIDTAAKTEVPLLLSTGMATAAEIERAVETVNAYHDDLTLLHCVSSYPLPMEQANLRAIQTLQRRFGTPVGYSDHTTGLETAAFAVMLGARVIEKHFTLDRTAPGPDQALSLEPAGFAEMVSQVHAADASRGDGELEVAAAERDSRYSMRRGVRTRSAISAGASIGRGDLKITRPEEGVRADELREVIGRVAIRDIGANEPLVWDDID
jgi:sialic acid synthase SpsE